MRIAIFLVILFSTTVFGHEVPLFRSKHKPTANSEKTEFFLGLDCVERDGEGCNAYEVSSEVKRGDYVQKEVLVSYIARENLSDLTEKLRRPFNFHFDGGNFLPVSAAVMWNAPLALILSVPVDIVAMPVTLLVNGGIILSKALRNHTVLRQLKRMEKGKVRKYKKVSLRTYRYLLLSF